MEDLNALISNSIKRAGQLSQAQDYKGAYDLIVSAEECAIKLAERSYGKQRKEAIEKFNNLKEIAKMLKVKMAEAEPVQQTYAEPVKPASSAPSSFDSPSAPVAGAADSSADHNTPTEQRQPRRQDSISPQYLDDYIGQPRAVTAVRDLISAALLKNSSLPHLILYGSHGLGKTTFANIIANEMHANFVEVNVSKINVTEMIAILKKIKPKDIVFIDEIHTLPLPVAESVLYSAMQDGRVTYTEGKGKFARTEVLVLPPFTLVGATTEIGKLAKPFTQRAIQIRLEEYSDEIIGGIIAKAFNKLGMIITEENALYVAKRCRNNPRIANNTVKRVADKALVRYAAMNNIRSAGSLDSVEAIRKLGIEITKPIIDGFFEENGIDEYGLERGDRELLRLLITRFEGGPVGVDTLARAMNESNNVITQKYEAYLIKKGLMKIEREGRVAMPEAYEVLGMPVPQNAESPEETEKTGARSVNAEVRLPNEEPKPASKYEKRTVVASAVPDEVKCSKIEDLITYPEKAGAVEESLDALFPDVERPVFESDPKHQCELEIDFGDFKRNITCDSFLESRFATSLAAVGYVKDLKAQTVELAYVSQELVNKLYFPDFVIKDYRGRIAIIEMKNFDMISYHLNIDKYEELKRFCESKGYGYAEIMRAYDSNQYISVEALKAAPINQELENYILDTIEKNGNETGEGIFTSRDFENFIAEYGATDKTAVYTILLNNRRLRNTDRVGNDFRIILN